MKHFGVLIALVLFLSIATMAQATSENPTTAAADPLLAMDLPASFGSVALSALPGGEPGAGGASIPQVTIQSVFPSYSWQAYLGYTFVRYYAFPAREVNRNGFDLGMAYYFRSGHFGAEGALTSTFGSIANQSSDFFFAGGGPRVRMAAPRGIELWAHGLIGGAYFGPRIAGFNQQGLGYEVGGGADITAHFQRFAYRIEADMIGTRLYNTSQYSPKFSVGIVYKF